MSSNFKKIRMLPSLIPEWDKSWFKIYSDKEDWTRCKIQEKDNVTNKTNYLCVTWAITMNFCPITDIESFCVEFWQIFFDARTWMVKKRLCKVFDKEHGGKKCKERSTWR